MEQFDEMALLHFAPLIEAHGLQLSEKGRNRLEFRNSRALLWIGWDALRTGEVATAIAPLYDKDDRYYGFDFELYLILRFKNDNPELIRGGPVRPEQLDEELRCRAALMQKYCGKLLDGDIDEFDKLKKHIRMDSHEYTTRGQMRSATARAGWAWTNGDSEKVVRELTAYEGLLDQIWKERLRAAKAIVEGKEPGGRDTK